MFNYYISNHLCVITKTTTQPETIQPTTIVPDKTQPNSSEQVSDYTSLSTTDNVSQNLDPQIVEIKFDFFLLSESYRLLNTIEVLRTSKMAKDAYRKF